MRILWIISSGWKEGGAENYLALLRPLFEADGHTVKILASDDRPDMPQFSDYQYSAHRGLWRAVFHTINPSAYFTLKKVLKEFKPDLVHVHTIGHGSPVILFPLKNYPTLLTIHGPESFIKSLRMWCFPSTYFQNGECASDNLLLKGKLRMLYYQWMTDPLFALGFRNIRGIISPSTYIQEVAKKDGLVSTLIPNGTELFAYHPMYDGDVNHRIVCAGRLEAPKGVDYLLRAFALLLPRIPKAQLSLVGDGSLKEDLKRLAQELGIADRTEFLGHMKREELEAVYARSSVAVMPSVGTEAFGLSGIEAMSVGRPVVASRVGGISDWLIDGKTGYLVPPGDEVALADALGRLLSDPNLLLEMTVHARHRAEAFSIETHFKMLLAFYKETVLRV